MPTPRPSEESRDEYVERCIPIVIEEGTAEDGSQAAAICNSMWEQATKGTKMKRKVRDFNLEVKEIDEEGTFEGYASVYDVIDVYREVVVRGAFEKSLGRWKAKGRLPPVLWQHQAREPLGPFIKMEEQDRGLYVQGRLLGEVQRAREARALVKAKAIGGLSIGFRTIIDEYSSETQLLSLKEIDLWEGSLATFPANEAAQIESIKAFFGDGLPNVREFEDFLREAGFSKSHAAAIATHGLGRLLREAEGRNGDVDVRSILDEVLKSPPITAGDIFT